MNTTEELGLHGKALDQQIDTARRLVRAAMLGVPRTETAVPHADELLAAHALLTALMALAEATPGITRRVAAVAFDVSLELTRVADGNRPRMPTTTATTH